MKKRNILSFTLVTASLIFNTSCSNNVSKISSYYHNNIDSMIYVDSNKLKSMVSNKQDFILFLWSDCGCGGPSDSVISTLNKYINETKLIIHTISSTDYQKLPVSMSDVFPIYPTNSNETIPSFYFYNDGKLLKKYEYSNDFLSIDGINNILKNYVNFNGLYSLNSLIEYEYDSYKFCQFDYSNTSLLDSSISNNKLTICYSWNECSDCNSLKKIINTYFESNYKKVYYFEVSYFRNNKSKETLWDDNELGFPYKYSFSDYRGGKVPTLVSYKDGEKYDMIVYHNDIVTDGLVDTSFFKDLIGKELSTDELENYHKNKIIEYISNLEE